MPRAAAGGLVPHIRATFELSTIAHPAGTQRGPGRHCVGMRSLETDILGLGGLAATHELYARGYGKRLLRYAVHTGDIIRVRKGWYCRPDLAVDLQQAARVGGRLACVSAARYYGLWVPGQPGALHVQVSPDACQLRSRSDYRRRLSDLAGQHVVVHWSPDATPSRLLVSVPSCVEQVARTHPAEYGFVVAESALHQGKLTVAQWHRILAGLPRRLRRQLAAAGKCSESGTESMFSFGMRRIGVRFRQQVRIGRDRVDFLIGDRLVVEIDSTGYHDAVADAKRDARLSMRGYRVLRFHYDQVVNHWNEVLGSVLAALSRGDHLAA
jgi:very-short-patch-repair endonuclease